MKVKKITKNKKEHTWDMEVPEVHSYVVGSENSKLICHNSSTTQNTTNGVEKVKSLIVYKSSKKSSIPFVVPNIKTHKDYYELAYESSTNIPYMNICNTIQKYMDMGMSVNQYFSPSNYEGNLIPYSQIIKELIEFWKGGGKALYYLNTDDKNKHFGTESCASGACTL